VAKSNREKNTKNKSKHSKLMTQKKNKLRKSKDSREQKLKELKAKIKAQKATNDPEGNKLEDETPERE